MTSSFRSFPVVPRLLLHLYTHMASGSSLSGPNPYSFPVAGVFVALYIALFALFLWKSVTLQTSVHYGLAFFCSIRIIAFVIRAVIARVDDLRSNYHILATEELLFNVAVFALLYSSYVLVLKMERLSGRAPSAAIFHNRSLFRLIIFVGVVLGTMASIHARSEEDWLASTTTALHQACAAIFLILTIFQALLTLIFVKAELSGPPSSWNKLPDQAPPVIVSATSPASESNTPVISRRERYCTPVALLALSFFLLVRQSFAVAIAGLATSSNTGRLLPHEYLWYPLFATPEVLAVALFCIPGLIPPRFVYEEEDEEVEGVAEEEEVGSEQDVHHGHRREVTGRRRGGRQSESNGTAHSSPE